MGGRDDIRQRLQETSLMFEHQLVSRSRTFGVSPIIHFGMMVPLWTHTNCVRMAKFLASLSLDGYPVGVGKEVACCYGSALREKLSASRVAACICGVTSPRPSREPITRHERTKRATFVRREYGHS